MCGRYALYGPASRHRDHFGTQAEFELGPRYNVAPSQMLPVVRQAADGTREFTLAKWGLLPSWVEEPEKIPHPINAKSETITSRAMFRHAFRKSRVLVPADAFYEWKTVAGGKQPYLIQRQDQAPIGIAGLLEHWTGPEGDIQTFAILTTEPNELMAPIHSRMPVIIKPQHYTLWLDPGNTNFHILHRLLAPYPADELEAVPISRRVNSPVNDGPELLTPETVSNA